MSVSEIRRTRLPTFSDRVTLGDSGLQVSSFCLGQVRSPDTVCVAFDAGINFFFLTTDLHWPLYEAARQGLRQLLARGGGIRQQIVVAAVCYPTQLELCRDPFRELLLELPELETLDIMVAGAAYADEFTAQAARLPAAPARAVPGLSCYRHDVSRSAGGAAGHRRQRRRHRLCPLQPRPHR